MEISASEIDLLCKRISASVTDYSISSIYSIESGILLRLRHSTKPERLIAISSFATWLTTKNLALSEANLFVSRLRDSIEREKLLSVERVGKERIAKFSFQGRNEEKRNLYAEFFAGGNLILTKVEDDRSTDDDKQEESILEVARPQRFRHRDLLPGEKYILPPSRGVSLEEISARVLQDLLFSDSRETGPKPNASKINAIRWFGRSVGTSRKFVEEIFFRSRVDPNLPLTSITSKDIESIADSGTSLLKDLEQSQVGYLFLPEEVPRSIGGDEERGGDVMDSNRRDRDIPLEVDVCPILTQSWTSSVESGRARVVQFPSFSEALDEAQVQSLIFERRMKASTLARTKAAELDSAINKQEALIETNRAISKEMRSIGNQIMTGSVKEITRDLLSKLESYDIIAVDEESGRQLRFKSEPRAYASSFTVTSLASRLFDEAKRLEQSNRRIESVREELISQRDELVAQRLLQEDKAQRKLVIDRRPREWFERYRWFMSSDGRLVIGGRDSTSNSVIINRYVNSNDIVFHADLYGSPFFVLKNSSDSKSAVLSDEIALEIAQATVSFSRAWKDELGAADAYWVFPSQIKKSAPSGEYLPRGSFFIEGKKNYVKHLKVELSVGVISVDNLPKGEPSQEKVELNDALAEQEERPQNEKDQVLIVCAPDKSLSPYSLSRVKIAPGKEKASSIARRIKQVLTNKVKEQELREMCKRITMDEIIRALPSGNYKMVSEKQNR